MLKEYVEYRKEKNIKDSTIKYETEQLESFLSFVAKFSERKLEPFEIKPIHVKSYLAFQKEEKNIKDSTIKRKLTTIRQFFHFLWLIGKIPNDFMPKVTYEYDIPEKIGITNYVELLNKKEAILRDHRLLLNDKLYFLLTLKGIKLQDIGSMTLDNVKDAGNKVILSFESYQGNIVKHYFYGDSEIMVFLQALERGLFRDHNVLIASTKLSEASYLHYNLKVINNRIQEVLNHPFKADEVRLSYIHYLYKVEEKSIEQMAETLGVSITTLTSSLKVALERYKHMDYNKATN